MKIKAQEGSPGTQSPRVLVPDEGMLKVRGAELYATRFSVGEDVTLEHAS
jgi:hypothetical protein